MWKCETTTMETTATSTTTTDNRQISFSWIWFSSVKIYSFYTAFIQNVINNTLVTYWMGWLVLKCLLSSYKLYVDKKAMIRIITKEIVSISLSNILLKGSFDKSLIYYYNKVESIHKAYWNNVTYNIQHLCNTLPYFAWTFHFFVKTNSMLMWILYKYRH